MRLSLTKKYSRVRFRAISIAFLRRPIGGSHMDINLGAIHLRSMFRLVYNLGEMQYGSFWVRK